MEVSEANDFTSLQKIVMVLTVKHMHYCLLVSIPRKLFLALMDEQSSL